MFEAEKGLWVSVSPQMLEVVLVLLPVTRALESSPSFLLQNMNYFDWMRCGACWAYFITLMTASCSWAMASASRKQFSSLAFSLQEKTQSR